MSLLALQTNQVMLLAGIGLIVLVFVNRLRRGFVTDERPSRRHRPSVTGPRRPTDTRPGEVIGSARLRSSTASNQQEAWEVEMHQLARQLKGEIETKMSALARLIQTADEARTQLQAAIDRADSLGLIEDETDRISQAASEMDENRRSPPHRAPTKKQPTALPHPSIAGSPDSNPADDPRFDRVYALADAGFSAARIASQIGSQVGEVELILSLRTAA
jgi:hypothetical protein